jgi:hypothetical protein
MLQNDIKIFLEMLMVVWTKLNRNSKQKNGFKIAGAMFASVIYSLYYDKNNHF